jgi:hypothetical protein
MEILDSRQYSSCPFRTVTTLIVLLALTGCSTHVSHPGAIESQTLTWTAPTGEGPDKKFDSTEAAQAFADSLQKRVKNLSSSNPAITPRNGKFTPVECPSGWEVQFYLEFEVAKAAPFGPAKTLIAINEENNHVMATVPVEIDVVSVAHDKAKTGALYLLFGALGLALGLGSGKNAGPFALILALISALMVLNGGWELVQALRAAF